MAEIAARGKSPQLYTPLPHYPDNPQPMGLADEIRLSRQADEDLSTINGTIEPDLFGELDLIPAMSEDECPPLPWQTDEPPRRRANLAAYVAVFFVEETEAGNVAVIEFVRDTPTIEAWWAELEAFAAREEARVECEELAEKGRGE
ncbi:MAG TPA: hypothetical protein VMT37_14035 [Solirubrobacterales bacterium]|nr:hypothetical protein [Solirubrobacterales bacterium]